MLAKHFLVLHPSNAGIQQNKSLLFIPAGDSCVISCFALFVDVAPVQRPTTVRVSLDIPLKNVAR